MVEFKTVMIPGVIVGALFVAAWFYGDVAMWLETRPKRDRKFRDGKIKKIDWG